MRKEALVPIVAALVVRELLSCIGVKTTQVYIWRILVIIKIEVSPVFRGNFSTLYGDTHMISDTVSCGGRYTSGSLTQSSK